jgi:hypothetical protein
VTDGSHTEVVEGVLRPGDQVITEMLKPGTDAPRMPMRGVF